MHIIFVDQIRISEYRDMQQDNAVPAITNEIQVTFHEGRLEDWANRTCREIREQIKLCDLRPNALEKWMDFRERVKKRTIGDDFPSPDGLYDGGERDQDADEQDQGGDGLEDSDGQDHHGGQVTPIELELPQIAPTARNEYDDIELV